MLKIALVNMPFASINRPSLGMTQLASVLKSQLGEQVSVELSYLNLDFARYLGVPFYSRVAEMMDHLSTGLGDWFFRQVAFPHLADNTEEYFKRCYPARTERTKMLKKIVTAKREGLDSFLDSLIDKYRLAEADIVGFGSTFMQNVGCFAMARKLKERNPQTITVMGGANCEAKMGRELARQVPQIDFVFSGPSLKSFPTLVQNILDNNLKQCHQINGVYSKQNCGADSGLITIERFGPIAEIGDDLPIDTPIELDYGVFLDTFEKTFPAANATPLLPIETSRGCWWGERAHCTFCGLNGGSMAYRSMSPDLAIRQFQSVFKYAERTSVVECVDNIMPKNYVREVLPFLEPPPDATIFYEVKADLTEEELQVLRQARVKAIQPGIEALATSTLKLMKKGTTAFGNLIFLKNCIKYDLRPSWNLLLGFPGEGEEVYRKYIHDLPMLTHLFPPSGTFPVRFDRFSPYHVQAKEYCLDLQPVDFYELTYPFSKEALNNLAYYFINRDFRAEYFMTMVKWIDKVRKETTAWSELWDRDGGFQPKLYFKENGNSTVVYDSRSGEGVEFDVGAIGKQVLECLDKPKDMGTLARQLSPNVDAEKEVAVLQERGLIFQEGPRYLSLVHLREPPTMSFRVELS